MPTTLTLEPTRSGVSVLRLERPDRLNAINEVMRDDLLAVYEAIGADAAIRVVVLTGSGRGFCSGIDVREFGASMPSLADSLADRLRHQERMASLPEGLRTLPQPVIAAVNGPAVGGGLALCLAADIRVCATSATFANGAIPIGLSGAEMGMSYYLPRVVGASVAADWMLTGRTVTAEEAHRRGLVSEVVDDAALIDRSIEIATAVAAHSALGVQMTKRALQHNIDAPDLAAALERERQTQVMTHATNAES